MRNLGTYVRLFLISCASAVATAAISTPFMTPAVAMSSAPTPEPPPPAQEAANAAAAPIGPAAGAPEIIRRVDNSDMRVSFTFDACATRGQANGFDRPVLRVLQREGVPATVFTSGRWVEAHPGAMRELTAEPLIEFANHSYGHPHLPRLTAEEIGAEIDRTEAALGRYGRQSVAFRPPFGDFNELVLQVARARRLPAVLWDVVSGDPSPGATPERMIRSVVRETRPGSIIIFHINGRETKTAAALPTIFRQLRARGFQFVRLSTLLASGASPAGPTTPMANPSVPLVDEDGVMPLSDTDDLQSGPQKDDGQERSDVRDVRKGIRARQRAVRPVADLREASVAPVPSPVDCARRADAPGARAACP